MRKNLSVRVTYLLLVITQCCFSCNPANDGAATGSDSAKITEVKEEIKSGERRYAGTFSNGMKGDSIFFTISEDGKKLEDLTFKGYWRCSGTLEQTTVGPEGFFEVEDGVVKGSIVEPPDGGSTAWRFELDATIDETKATGNFRMNINNLGCDTYKLNFTALPR